MDLVQAKPQTIVFNNQILTTFEKDGVRYVAIKPICENMGIEWSTQLQKLNRNKEKFGCVHSLKNIKHYDIKKACFQ